MAVTTAQQTFANPIALYDATAQTANIGATTIYAIPAGSAGMYRIHLHIKITTAGSVSSTMPSVDVIFTSNGVAITTGTSANYQSYGSAGAHLIATNTGNTTATGGQATLDAYCDASTNIQIVTAGYASNAAGMAYELRVRVEYLG